MKPIIQPLAKWQRTFIFVVLLIAFLVSLPALMFYAAGYRYDFFAEIPTITATGGLYLAAPVLDSLIYLDEELVNNARVFRSASYIQGLEPGLHRVHVQAEGRHTWVKELLIAPHMVTEVEAFNLPLWPQVRPVTEYVTVSGNVVVQASSTIANEILSKASTTIPFYLATTTATTTYRTSAEFKLLAAMFAEKAEAKMARETAIQMALRPNFAFATATATSVETVLATTTKHRNNLSLYQVGEEVYVAASGLGRDIPNYFCSNQVALITDKDTLPISEEIFNEGYDVVMSESEDVSSRQCRGEIKIDRSGKEVIDFEFMPLNVNLVLLVLTDGIYVVEIDDRSWQNAQLLYPGHNLELVLYGENIFVKEGGLILELLTDTEPL